MLAWLESLRSKAFATRATPDKPASGSCIIKENMSNKELAEELHKPIIRKFKKRKLHSPFIDKSFNLADMQLIKESVFYYVSPIFSINTNGLEP